MKQEYDLAHMKSRKNPYATRQKRRVSIRIRDDVISYFKEMSEETGIPFQTLINLYLRDCMTNKRRPDLRWH